MERNIGELERLLRVILGIYAMLMGFLFIQGVAGIVLGALGLLSVVTGLVGWCAVYTLLGKGASEPVAVESRGEEAAEPEGSN
ncbi:MAG: DUF2892 domain-containing protein [Anaerolineae bacterium]|nr:DUF2892 domain-containing protein [Anaerolineae bacterium]